MKTKILIADDHSMFADGIASILNEQENLEVIGKCIDGLSVEGFLENNEVDLILLDVNLPGKNGIEVCKDVLKVYPKIHILAISMHNQESYVSEILKNGAKGYILKNTGRDELLQAISSIQNGETFFSKDVTETIMRGLMNERKASNANIKLIPKITRREKEVLKLIVQEHTTQEIADKLYIALKTVESHRSSLLAKLNARNTAGLVRITIENKLLD